MSEINFSKLNGLVPAVIQDHISHKVLMVGFMNEEALDQTQETGKVTFYSRSKRRLWKKGETSGNYLHVKSITEDCDHDTLLIKVQPDGPACHTGADTCFNETNDMGIGFLNYLSTIISSRKREPQDTSYTSSLFEKGMNKIAQKVGEEAVELVIEALNHDDDLFKNEAADLIFHLLVLLEAKEIPLAEIVDLLKKRHDPS